MLVVVGSEGQVGRAIRRAAARLGRPVRGLGRGDLDITDAARVRDALRGAAMVVNAAAFTAVDRAEREPSAAFAVNRDGAANLAAACAEAGVPLLHLSTDYVFDGTAAKPYEPDAPVRPLNVYGASKAAGETAVRRLLPRHLILRAAWLFSGGGEDFVTIMRRLARCRDEIAVVADQRGGPTPAPALAEAVLTIAETACQPGFAAWGTYHFCGRPAVSRHDFAAAILADLSVRLRACSSAEFPQAAPRPANSVLNCTTTAAVFGVRQPDWRPALADLVKGEAL